MSVATMAKPKSQQTEAKGKEKPGRKTAPIQVDAELAAMAVSIAAHDKKNVSDLITPLIRQWILTNYERVQKEMSDRLAAAKAGTRQE